MPKDSLAPIDIRRGDVHHVKRAEFTAEEMAVATAVTELARALDNLGRAHLFAIEVDASCSLGGMTVNTTTGPVAIKTR